MHCSVTGKKLKHEFLILGPKRTAKYGTEIVTYRGPQIWNLLPEKTKNASSFELFKKEIRKWKGEMCPYRICKTYIQHVGLI